MSAHKYQAYKEVSIPWISLIPEHWEWKPVLGAARERDEDNKGMKEDNLLSLSYGNIVNKDINTSDGLLPESFETYQIVRPGDIVLRLTDLQNDKRSLRSALVTQKGIITSAYLALEPKSIESRYLGYLLRAYDISKVFYSMGGGLRQSMKYADVKRMPLVMPTKAEQLGIATFLDCETAKIDALIAEQQRLIELLQEKRQAVISHAVTKGLNPEAPMKDSGVDWLGDVPEHWKIKPVKHLCSLLRDGTHLPPPRVAHGIPLLSVRNIQGECFSLRDDDSLISEDDYKELCRSFIPQSGDTLLAIVGATMGKTAIVPSDFGNFHLQRSVGVFRTRDKDLNQDWLHLVFRSKQFQGLLWRDVAFSAQPGIYLGALKDVPIPVPSLVEQSNIVESSNQRLHQLNVLIIAAQDAIALQQERRSAIISAAVTGQIDVRSYSPEAAVA